MSGAMCANPHAWAQPRIDAQKSRMAADAHQINAAAQGGPNALPHCRRGYLDHACWRDCAALGPINRHQSPCHTYRLPCHMMCWTCVLLAEVVDPTLQAKLWVDIPVYMVSYVVQICPDPMARFACHLLQWMWLGGVGLRRPSPVRGSAARRGTSYIASANALGSRVRPRGRPPHLD